MASLAFTCKSSLGAARQSAWSTCMRFRNLGYSLKVEKKEPIKGPSPLDKLSTELISTIMEMIAPRHLVSLARTCTRFRIAFRTHMLSATYKALNKVHLPPSEFMEAMLSTSSIIAGSVPANILTGGSFAPNDLDVVTPASEEDTMIAMLKNYGFELVEAKVPRGMQENPTVPIMLTATTFVMNFISPWGIYCAYPRMTLTERGLLNYFTDEGHDTDNSSTYSRVMRALNKYIARGVAFQVDDRNWPDMTRNHSCFVSASCTHTTRNLYDSAGLHISFPVEHKGYRRYFAENTRLNSSQTTIWSLGGHFCGSPVLYHRAFSRNVILHMKRPEVEALESDDDSDVALGEFEESMDTRS
ncbi:hypothetical protein B0H16DRAFT_1826310 [Mycena metata]|uniref:F-box domain-containing protein n=1 Tax=Mycena metata TaxID=1033252 RepID=A0AAD7M8P4_9AGAR|nr:hypothetical protein B0H16DRAFT_1826310 [Mycena metata]